MDAIHYLSHRILFVQKRAYWSMKKNRRRQHALIILLEAKYLHTGIGTSINRMRTFVYITSYSQSLHIILSHSCGTKSIQKSYKPTKKRYILLRTIRN